MSGRLATCIVEREVSLPFLYLPKKFLLHSIWLIRFTLNDDSIRSERFKVSMPT